MVRLNLTISTVILVCFIIPAIIIFLSINNKLYYFILFLIHSTTNSNLYSETLL